MGQGCVPSQMVSITLPFPKQTDSWSQSIKQVTFSLKCHLEVSGRRIQKSEGSQGISNNSLGCSEQITNQGTCVISKFGLPITKAILMLLFRSKRQKEIKSQIYCQRNKKVIELEINGFKESNLINKLNSLNAKNKKNRDRQR